MKQIINDLKVCHFIPSIFFKRRKMRKAEYNRIKKLSDELYSLILRPNKSLMHLMRMEIIWREYNIVRVASIISYYSEKHKGDIIPTTPTLENVKLYAIRKA